ncbi:PaaI family thioesterase [Pseudomonas cavernicola]|uniref:PaaI family thioesterase n=1 Tax=Pseudomonas cavernicola TaxID=2320866 RepID=A0A418XNY8_9PSED|nr:PaaI family thioesterase [Pseudomonas cavernicola]RJG14193.1 PaaI family thioesterase [Pseudomonas cavernicola]
MDSPTAITRERLEEALQHSPFAQMIGFELTEFAPGQITLEVLPRRELTQHHGFVHGAVVGFMIDSACAWAAASVVGDVVTSEYKVNLLAPAIGEKLICRSAVIKAGQRQVVTRADVFALRDGQEKIVATGLATIARV